MEILLRKNHQDLLSYLPYVKTSLKAWLFVDIRLTEACDKDFTVTRAAEHIHALFKDKEGKIYICNDREILMIVRWGQENPQSGIADTIGKSLPGGNCEVHAQEPTADGVAKLEILLTYKSPVAAPTLIDIRSKRKERVLLVADDDMFQRSIIKKGLSKIGTVIEVSSGDEVESAYRQHNPDILFLDIHMPGLSGRDIVYKMSELDPDSYIIMVSADGTQENIADTWQKGARDFLIKPFSKERLLECVRKCPTIHLDDAGSAVE
ncbi:MAG: response regulator [Alphaproteobacteria bacterium]|nr:response regulator [Alphaproteobacteria bacterium]